MSANTQKVLMLSFLTGAAACSAAPPGSEDVGSSGAALSASDKSAYDFFVGKGLKNFQAAGIVGNLDQESSMSPTVEQYGGGPGRGIAQWSAGGRWDTDHEDNVIWYANKEGESATSLNLQLEFVWYELTTFSGYGLSRLKASTNVTDATIAFQTDFEGCGECDQGNRISYAEAALNAYGSSTPAPAPTCKGGAEAVTRAEQWVNAELHYCQSAYEVPDPDSSCWGWEGGSHRCDRESNSAWNAYRSDCSGLVTWAWGLPPVGDGGYVTSEFAPANDSFSKVIPAESLQPGDAINWNDGSEGHIMLFKQWVHAGTEAIFIQEPGCSAYPYHATETTASVIINGPSIQVPSVIDGAVFTAIRYNGDACSASSSTTDWGGGSSPTSCYSETLGRDVANDTCVWSSSDGQLWECTRGSWDLPADNGAPCAATYNGTEKSGGGAGCHSDTLRREVSDNACVQSDINSDWYQCANGNWVDRWTDPSACNGLYPLSGSDNSGDRCYSDTLGREMSDNACVQSASNDDWYQCDNGDWTDRWTDPAACNGVYPR
jgi:hypothetical protein